MPNPSYESQMLNASPAGSADQVIRPPVSPLLRLPTELQIEIGRHLPLASHLIYHFQVCRALRMLMTRPGLIFTGGHGYWSLTEWLVAASELQQIFAHRVGPVKEAGDQLPLPSQSPLGGKEYKVAVTTTSEGDRHSDLATLALDFLGLTRGIRSKDRCAVEACRAPLSIQTLPQPARPIRALSFVGSRGVTGEVVSSLLTSPLLSCVRTVLKTDHHDIDSSSFLYACSPWYQRRVPTALLASTISDDEFRFALGAPMVDASRVVGLSSKARRIFGKLGRDTRPRDRLERLSRTLCTRDSRDALQLDGLDQFPERSRARLSLDICNRTPQSVYAVKTQAVVEMGSEAPSWMHIKGRGLQAGYSALCFAAEHVYWAAQRRCESDERPEAWKSFELTEEIEQELLQELDGPLHVILHGSEDEQGALDLEKALLYSKIRCVHCHRPIIWE